MEHTSRLQTYKTNLTDHRMFPKFAGSLWVEDCRAVQCTNSPGRRWAPADAYAE